MKYLCLRALCDGFRLSLLLIPLSVLSTSVFGDEVKEVRYGVVEGRRPTEISSGLFGMGKKPGMAYTITLVQGTRRLEIDSPNTSFLVGDCVAVVGEGKDTTLARAESHLCTGQPTAVVNPQDSRLKAHGTDSASCQQARKETSSWPPGLGRRRALLREMMVCGQPTRTNSYARHPLGQSCSQAWADVERLPFGPQRASARERAREKCAR